MQSPLFSHCHVKLDANPSVLHTGAEPMYLYLIPLGLWAMAYGLSMELWLGLGVRGQSLVIGSELRVELKLVVWI